MTNDVASEPHVDLTMSPTGISFSEEYQQLKSITTKAPAKRSFDVAFLMLPDEKLKHKHRNNNSPEINVSAYPLTELSVRSDLINRSHSKIINDEFVNLKSSESRFCSGLLKGTAESEKVSDVNLNEIPRSAFSKVSQILNVDSSVSPPISPDQLSCSSASPPISYSPPSTNFRHDYSHFINSSAFQAIEQPNHFTQQGKFRQFLYRNSSNSADGQSFVKDNGDHGRFHNFQFGASNPHVFMNQPEQFIRNPAAAILSTLLPTTLGALSLPAQNVCAKCNISFRMTSDLVYHMRSHHKNENVQDPNRRKREEKLKCPVCSESFRERHHLTRHMTAHQDKEGDLLDHEIVEYTRRK